MSHSPCARLTRSQRLALATTALFLLPLAGALAQGIAITLDTVVVESGGQASGRNASGNTAAGASGGDFQTDGYVATNAVSASKTSMPLVKVPQSVSVVTEEQLEDRNAQTLLEAVSYAAETRVGAYGFDPR